MKIAILGAGAIGSTIAVQLAKAHHAVTLIARGARLAKLTKDGGVVETVPPNTARVEVAAALDAAAPFDLVLVTVLAHQVDAALLTSLKQSAARTVMFMANTVADLDPYRAAVGEQRCAFGFPFIEAQFLPPSSALEFKFRSGVQTVVDDARWLPVFKGAGIPARVQSPETMQAWYRSHAAAMVTILGVANIAARKGRGATWAEASQAADAFHAALRVVRKTGAVVTPATMPYLPVATLLWLGTKSATQRAYALNLGTREVEALADAFAALGDRVGAREEAEKLRALKAAVVARP